MMHDYLEAFPLPTDVIPEQLRRLLTPVGLDPREEVEIARFYESPDSTADDERLYMQMAVVSDQHQGPLDVFRETGSGVVKFSVPVDMPGAAEIFTPSISGHDYMVASWGNGSFYTFNLAEKVWMTMGLSPRCIGNAHQKMIYDDLALPEVGIAGGEISSEYYWRSNRSIRWTMRSDYFRKYLWLRSARAVRSFYYRARLPEHPCVQALMGSQSHIERKPETGPRWYELDIRKHRGHLLMQVWASVVAADPQLCPELSADGLVWPGIGEPMTRDLANSLISGEHIYLDDRFLERYEQNAFYETTPGNAYGDWHCSPSYKGQWSFTECVRVGRNLISVPVRQLYNAIPDREILHAHKHALSPQSIAHLDLGAEHIVSKTQRLLDQILMLGENLSTLAKSVDIYQTAEQLTGFSREKLRANGWTDYPSISTLAQAAPLAMTQQAFLSRCKQIHEILQKVPNGFVRKLLIKAGCPKNDVNSLGLLKCLQGLFNVLERMNSDQETLEAFTSNTEPEGWNDKNPVMAPLFLNNDLRIADAHQALAKCVATLQDMGFDTAHLNDGYGLALDFVMDGVIASIAQLNSQISRLIHG